MSNAEADGDAIRHGRVDSTRLQQIAVDAMRSRGFLASFSPEALEEAQTSGAAGIERHAAIRDLRGLLWFSIDNDDTQDIDQLSFAEPLAAGAALWKRALAQGIIPPQSGAN